MWSGTEPTFNPKINQRLLKGIPMIGLNLSPLQFLAANAIAAAAGASIVLAFQLYGRHMHNIGTKQARNRS